MEDAMLLSRIMRAPDKRTFYIEIGNMEGAEADQYIDSVINRMKKVPYIDESTGEYNLKFNLQNMLEDFYIPQRGGNRAAEIDSTGGLENAMIDDIEYLQKKLFAALRVPKAFLSYEESLESKATLAGLDLRFARTITRLQKIVISELNQIAMLHLYIHGFRNEKMVDFELELSNPSIVYDEEKINF